MPPSAMHKSRADLLKTLFVHRKTIAVAISGSPTPATYDTTLTDLLLTHVAGYQAPETGITIDTKNTKGSYLGRYRVGSYVQGDDDLVRWLCLDLDGGSEHKRPLADPLATALYITNKAHQLSLPCYLEKSGGAKGWHVWLFFAQPQPVELARVLGLGLCPTDAKLDPSGIADALSGVGIEVFPKSFHARDTGNMVWLPWWSGAKPGGSLFYDPDSLLPLDVTTFETVSPEAIGAALSALPDVAHWKAPKVNTKKAAEKRAKLNEGAALNVDEASEVFKQWREAALSKIDLEEVYSPHLIDLPGENNKEWLKCRNPFTPPDTTPSAGVSSGSTSERGAFHEFHSDTTISLFDFLIKIGKVPTLPAAFRYVARLTGVSLPERTPKADPLASSADTRPQIIVTGQQLDALVDDVWGALSRAEKAAPKLFLRGGQIVHVRESDPEQLPSIEVLNLDALRHYLSRVMRWYKVNGDELQACYPPKEIVSDLLACPRADLLPLLDGITCTPLFDASGVMCLTPGYNRSVRSWYEDRGLVMPPVSHHPSGEEVQGALTLLSDELLGDFNFASPSDKAHAIGCIILPFVRPMIKGPTPLHSIEAPTEGSGKTLLITIISAIALGLDAEIGALPDDEKDIRDRLFSELSSGRPLIAFDNANTTGRKTIDSAALEGVLTSGFWSDRVFHTQSIKSVKNRACWFLTGVNLLYSKGIKRRRVRVRIDPKIEDPWKRIDSSFKHPQPQWSFSQRGHLVAAVITLVNHWLSKGQPKASAVLGRFEQWSHVVGGILEAAGITDWLGYLSDPSEQVTEESRSDWHELCQRWVKANGGRWLTAAEVNKLAEGDGFSQEEPLLVTYRRGEQARGQAMTLAKELLRRRDQVFGAYRLVVTIHKKKGQAVYGLEAQEGSEVPPDEVLSSQGKSGASAGHSEGYTDDIPF